ncbi:hypothetical protein PM082_017986 [Marasmius tenuissimus]|nr:hypothetical protein PM082_017986 [Marasmius tenuissimus]
MAQIGIWKLESSMNGGSNFINVCSSRRPQKVGGGSKLSRLPSYGESVSGKVVNVGDAILTMAIPSPTPILRL